MFSAAETQELRDMLIMPQQNTNDPIYLLAAPTINAQRTGPSFAWGNFLRVYARIAFPQTVGSIGDQQIWYQVSDSSLTNAQGWIPVRYDGRNYLDQLDPCLGLVPTPTSLTFPYNRSAAANYAIEQSYANSISSPQPNYASRRIAGLQFGDFRYSHISGQLSQTGSAVFVSESIWFGGLPFTNGDQRSCRIPPTTGVVEGWRYCSDLPSATIAGTPYPALIDSASNPWDFHQMLLNYYTSTNVPGSSFPPSILTGLNIGTQLNFQGCGTVQTDRISSGNGPNDAVGQDLDVFYVSEPNNGSDRNGILSNPSGLESYIQTVLSCNQQSLVQGDYVYINPQDPFNPNPEAIYEAHGFLVVGWGPVVTDCRAFFTSGTRITINNLSASRTSANTIPYLADFNGLQLQTARPFYCTMAFDDGPTGSYFYRHDWFFFHLPDQIVIPLSDVYVNRDWNW